MDWTQRGPTGTMPWAGPTSPIVTGRKRGAQHMGPSFMDMATELCARLRRGEYVDPYNIGVFIRAARDAGAIGTDAEVIAAACTMGAAVPESVFPPARRGFAPEYQRQGPSQGAGRKRRAQEAPGTPTVDAIARDICRRVYRGETVAPDEIEALREIAREQGVVGANAIGNAAGLCRAALVLMGESPASVASLAGRGMHPTIAVPPLPRAPPSSPVAGIGSTAPSSSLVFQGQPFQSRQQQQRQQQQYPTLRIQLAPRSGSFAAGPPFS